MWTVLQWLQQATGSGDDVEMNWFRSSFPVTAGELFLHVGAGRVSDFCAKNLSWEKKFRL
jgi:hypothetical protein